MHWQYLFKVPKKPMVQIKPSANAAFPRTTMQGSERVDGGCGRRRLTAGDGAWAGYSLDQDDRAIVKMMALAASLVSLPVFNHLE